MARLRRGGVGPQREAVYAPDEPFEIPAHLSDLETVSGRCFDPGPVTVCSQPAPGIVCQACAMRELGESWVNFKARTNAAAPKARFYRDLEAAQAAPDPEFRRAFVRSRTVQ